jgi:hypothetical protein
MWRCAKEIPTETDITGVILRGTYQVDPNDLIYIYIVGCIRLFSYTRYSLLGMLKE